MSILKYMDYCIYCGKKLKKRALACSQCGKEVKEYRGIDTYRYEPVLPTVAEVLEQLKVGRLNKEHKKEMIKAIYNGEVGIAPVMIEKVFTESRGSDPGDGTPEEYTYANVSDPDGYPAKEAPRILVKHMEPQSENVPAFLLAFKLSDTVKYVVLDRETAALLPAALLEVIGMRALEPAGRRLPVFEDAAASRDGIHRSKLFGRRKLRLGVD